MWRIRVRQDDFSGTRTTSSPHNNFASHKNTEVTKNQDRSQVCSAEMSNLFRPIPREKITSFDVMCGKGKKCFNNTGTWYVAEEHDAFLD